MKLIIALLLSITAFAQSADLECQVNERVVLPTNFGERVFNGAEITIRNLSRNTSRTSITARERFGAEYAFYNRLYNNRTRCFSNNICLSTDFSAFRGMTFEVPARVLQAQRNRRSRRGIRFNMRMIQERTGRTYFANCFVRR